MRTSSSSVGSKLTVRSAAVATFALLVASLSGCATRAVATRPSTVSEADFARLAAGQTEDVDEARAQLAAATDELGRAKLGALNGQHEGAFARSDQAAASAEQGRAATETKVGQDSNEPGQLRQARDDTRAALRSKEAADTRLAYSKKLEISLRAQVTASERKVDLMTARVNLAKLEALERAGIPAAGKYDRGGALAAVTQAQRAHSDAVAAAAEAAQAADQLRSSQP
jgi:hypothetical protein